ncbi:uncharacterized protein cubi_00641 [Cryptosporidium ubiquitum]|uniref:Uncharacterized protein n=1 Tax=Cryptosporidium ubiquitum TaxID=857276 RepID=A0A1J4MC77_9CRYT|nr:uncharacterized protein cubi_00641 [Cryptosporidium ubiquitum]OII71833.1 hypothetical protein cubi_00641 [Cryptosporidium ubiquitum]
MKHFFSINRILPNISIELKFGLNNIFDLIQDQHTQYRILNAIYILCIDLKNDIILESGSVINDLIKLIGRLLELEKYEENNNLDLNIIAVETFLDVFFLLKFPKNCQLINIINSKISELKLKNFWVLGQLINELYQNSRESNYKLHESILIENRHIENRTFEQKDRNIESDTLNVKFDEHFEDFQDISQIFEYKNSIKIGVPTYLDFEYEPYNSKRINFFYLDEDEMDVVYRNVKFSFSLTNQILENLFNTLKNFQNKYQYNPVSILIYRLIIYRYTEFGNNTINKLNQLIENSKSEALVTSLFECSLLIKDEELYNIFDFYIQLENSHDFLDVVITINNLIRLHLENYSSSLNKFSSWIKTKKNDRILKLDRKLINANFPNTFEMVKYYLDHFKTELCLISKKFQILASTLKENNHEYCYNHIELALNEIKTLIFSTPIFNRNDLLEIIRNLFSINLDEYINLYFYMYSCDSANGEPARKINNYLDTKHLINSTLHNAKYFQKNYLSKSESCDLRFRSIKLLREIQNYDFLKELLFVLQTISKRQQLIFWWYINSNEIPFISEFVSKLFAERRRIGTLQCYLSCMEIEFTNLLNNNLQAHNNGK